jgi:hypothetical protein
MLQRQLGYWVGTLPCTTVHLLSTERDADDGTLLLAVRRLDSCLVAEC